MLVQTKLLSEQKQKLKNLLNSSVEFFEKQQGYSKECPFLMLFNFLQCLFYNRLMINNKKVVIIMPAYNAEKTLKQTYDEIYKDFVDEVILVDDNSQDNTKLVSKELNITTIVHKENKGYGGNQKSCYKAALKAGADIVVMLHPDYQYTPKLIPAIVCMMAFGQYDAVLASRMLGNSALKGGMPFYKFVSNKFLSSSLLSSSVTSSICLAPGYGCSIGAPGRAATAAFTGLISSLLSYMPPATLPFK